MNSLKALPLLIMLALTAGSAVLADVGTQQRLGRITAAEIVLLCAQPGVEVLEIEDNGVLITIVCDELPYDPEYPGEDD